MTEINTRSELLAALRDDAARLPDVAASISEADLDRGVYENGWSARQLLAHIAAIEWTYPRLIEQAQIPAQPRSAGSSSARFDMDAYNQKQVANRSSATIADLLAEFTRNREATIDAVTNADAALLEQPTRSAGGVEGTLLEVLVGVTVEHVRGHIEDLATAAR